MFKKIMIAALLTLPTVGWSNSITPGFYLGAGLGADTANFSSKSNVMRPGTFNVTDKTEEGAQGILGNLFVGYNIQYCRYYLAAEANFSGSTAKFRGSNEEYISGNVSFTRRTINNNWGLSLLPGMLLPESTLIYGRFGYAEGSYDTNTTDGSLVNNSVMLHGLRFGLGIEKNIYKAMGVRFEYTHINYQQYSSSVHISSSNVSKKVVISPSTNQFELDFIYRLT